MNALKKIWNDPKVRRARAKLKKIDAQRKKESKALERAKKQASLKIRKKSGKRKNK